MMDTAYVIDKEGGTFIAATQRPDGTWRKQRKVKDGYVPQEEVPLYESKGKIFEKNQPKYPVGLSEEFIREAQLRREADLKRQQQSQQTIPGLNNTSNGKKKKKKKSASEKREKVTTSEDLLDTPFQSSFETTRTKEEEWTVVGKSKTTTATANSTAVTKKEPKKESTQGKAKSSASQATQKIISDSIDPAKRVKNLRKKLREIEAIQEKKTNGAKLEKDQLEKLQRKEDVEMEIAKLVSQFNLS